MIDTFLVKLGLKRRNLFLQFRRLGGIRFGFGQLALQYTRFLIQIGSHILGCFEERFPFLFELLVLLFAHWVIVSRTTNHLDGANLGHGSPFHRPSPCRHGQKR
jgi:hypothetical protein